MRILLPGLFFILSLGTVSPGQSVSDSLNLAKQLRSEGKIHKSYILLKTVYSHHPDDLNVAWLTAQTAYWANHIQRSKKIYQGAIKSNPQNLYLQLDFAKMLVNTGDFASAEPLLRKYLDYDSLNAQALTAEARIYFWRCKYHSAAHLAAKAMKSDPQFTEAASLSKEIALARSPYLKISAGFTSDDQPLQTFSTAVTGGVYFNALSALHVSLQSPFFIRDGKTDNAYIFQAGNTSFFSRANLTIALDAGIIRFPVKDHYSFTGSLGLDKLFLRHLELALSLQREPYFATRTSIDTVVVRNHLLFSAGWNDMNGWYGQAAAEAFTYPLDHNLVYSGYAWLFAPPLKFSGFELRFGYGYNYSNSMKNKFVPENSLQEIIAGFNKNTAITGIYDPYYTPDDQQIHSLLLSFSGKPLKWLNFGVNANAGVYATAMAPYFYLDKGAHQSTVLNSGSAAVRFFPLNIRLQVLFRLSEAIHLRVDYAYNKTYYYTSNYAGIGINISFPDEKERK